LFFAQWVETSHTPSLTTDESYRFSLLCQLSC